MGTCRAFYRRLLPLLVLGTLSGCAAATCTGYTSLGDGTYSFQVGAPGYETLDVSVTLTFGTGCCSTGTLSPNTFVLMSADGGP